MRAGMERVARRWRARGATFVHRSWPARRIDRLELSEDGLQIFRGAVTADKCRRALEAVLSYVRADLRAPNSWRNDPSAEGFRGLVPLHHPQAFWDVRQDTSVHAAFAHISRSDALWVTIDRA